MKMFIKLQKHNFWSINRKLHKISLFSYIISKCRFPSSLLDFHLFFYHRIPDCFGCSRTTCLTPILKTSCKRLGRLVSLVGCLKIKQSISINFSKSSLKKVRLKGIIFFSLSKTDHDFSRRLWISIYCYENHRLHLPQDTVLLQ